MRSEKPVELHRGLVPKDMFQATNTTLPPQRQRADPLVRISCLAGFCLHMRRSPSTTAQIPTIGERLRWFTVFLFLMPLMMRSLPELLFVPGATMTVFTPTGLSGRRYLWTTDHAEPSASPRSRTPSRSSASHAVDDAKPPPIEYTSKSIPARESSGRRYLWTTDHFVSFIVVNALPWSTSVPPPRSPPCSRRSSRARAPPP